MNGRHTLITVACAILLLAATAQAGVLTREIADLEDGTLHFDFESIEGCCGDGKNYISLDGDRHYCGHWDDDDNWRDNCEEGPVHVALRLRDGKVRSLKTTVGPRNRDKYKHFIADVDPQEAVDFLLHLARTARPAVAEDAIFPAMLAEGVEVWPELLDMARDDDLDGEVREQSVFWLSQAAGDKATQGLERLVADNDEDLEVRETAVFGLSQRDTDAAVPALIEVAMNNPHPQLRESALFWLGQQDDPRVLELFEEILLSD